MLAAPEGNEFCVIEAGNGFLDDTIVPSPGSTQADEVDRLVALGARRLDLELEPGEVVLVDPDDNEFSIAPTTR